MSKKSNIKDVNNVSDLADNALSNDSEPLNDDKSMVLSDVLDSQTVTSLKPYSVLLNRRKFVNGRFVNVEPCEFNNYINFNMSTTEQIHALSLAEQIKRGQGQAQDYSEKEKLDYYDFPNGRDDGRKPVGLYELSEPAYAYEREQEFKNVVGADIREQALSKALDKSVSDSVSKASNGSINVSENKVGDKSSTSS